MPEHIVTIASREDVPELTLLINSAYRGDDARKGWTHEADLIDGEVRIDDFTLVQMFDDADNAIIKYTIDRKIVGCVYLQKRQDYLYLGMLSVSPTIQGAGIGKKLLSAAESHAVKNACSYIEMNVISIRYELISWYQRYGYTITDRKKPFPNDKKFGTPRTHVEFMIMEKRL